jgi:hypothetical protein
MLFRSNHGHMGRASLYQRSCAAALQAEKVNALASMRSCPTPSNPCFYRLDGWNPHVHWRRQPPNLANLFSSRTHVRRRAYTRVDIFDNLLSVKHQNRLARLGGWQSQCHQRFQPSNHPSNHFGG